MSIESLAEDKRILVADGVIEMTPEEVGPIHDGLRHLAAKKKKHFAVFVRWKEPTVALGRNQVLEVNVPFCSDNGIGVAKCARGGNTYYHEPGDLSIYFAAPASQGIEDYWRMQEWGVSTLRMLFEKLTVPVEFYNRWAVVETPSSLLTNAHDGVDIRKPDGKLMGVLAVNNQPGYAVQGFFCLRLSRPDTKKMLGAALGYRPEMEHDAVGHITHLPVGREKVCDTFLGVLGDHYGQFRFENGHKADYDFTSGYLAGGLVGMEHIRDLSIYRRLPFSATVSTCMRSIRPEPIDGVRE
jgi:lipoate-protein ligase A